jgi:3-deoxy-7-phosphoheptulonate synthase
LNPEPKTEKEMNKTDDLRVLGYCKLIQPGVLKKEMPVSQKSIATVVSGRENVQNILSKKDKRMLVIVGPCSIHDEKASLEYAEKLNQLSKKVDQTLCIIMRVYFEKPRTTVGWKGLINDPQLDGSHNITDGLRKARKILMQITEMGMPAATEMLEMVTPQYVADLVSWAAIGARTTESQTHRELASGLSMPVGFKNGTDGILWPPELRSPSWVSTRTVKPAL